MMWKFAYARPVICLMVAMSMVTLPTFFPPLQPIPANDADLEGILAQIKPYEDLANQCSMADCPELDCAAAQQMQIKLRDARILMRYTAYWLGRATDDQLRHLTNISNESTEANARAVKVQKIMAYQQWIVGIGSGMLEIASLSTNINEIINNPKLLQSKSYGEMAGLLDTFYEGMKDGETLIHRLRQGSSDRDFPKPIADMMPALEGLSSSEMNDLKSTFSDAKTLMEAAQKHGKDWRAILGESKNRMAIGQIAGRYVKAYAEAEIAERKRLVDSLLNDVIAQDTAQSQAFTELARIQIRRNKAEDAYMALDKLLVASPGQGQMTQCLLKIQKSCTALDVNYASQYQVPADIEVTNFTFVTETDRQKSWGKALLTINALLPTVENWLKEITYIKLSSPPSLQLNKFIFTAGEEIAVQAKVPSCQKASAWVGIISADVEHGDESQNAQKVLSVKQQLSESASGAMQFNAPQKAGRYDVRLNDSASGKELASVSFQVGCNTAEEAVTIPTADALKRIESLKKTIEDRRRDMSSRYSDHAYETLMAEFQHSNVYWKARNHARSWHGSIVVTWINGVARFYGTHFKALEDSARHIKSQESVRQSDLVYLENGVTAWQGKEKQLSHFMFSYVYHMGKYGYFAGERYRIEDSGCHVSRSCPDHEAVKTRYNSLGEMQGFSEELEKQSKQNATELAGQTLFSSLGESNRIRVENSEPCQ